MSNFQNSRVPPTRGSRLPHAYPGSFEMRRTVPVPIRGAGDGHQSNLARSRGTCRVKARCSGRCAGCGQRRGRFFEVKNRPRANPVRGVGETGIAESRCDGEVHCPMLAETTLPFLRSKC
jgi:hypothetical protein